MSLPFWENNKAWGRVLHCFRNNQASVSYLEVVKGHQSSIHRHLERANDFVVISGVIEVDVWGLYPDEVWKKPKTHTLGPSDTLTVASLLYHRFQVIESGKLIEVYWPDRPGGRVRLDDIERVNVGGPIRG